MTDFICQQYVLISDPYSNDKGSHGGRIAREQLAAILRRSSDIIVKQTRKNAGGIGQHKNAAAANRCVFVINCISSAVDGPAEKRRGKDVSPAGTPAGRAGP